MRFLVLGPLEVRVDGRELALGAGKQRLLLALLLLHADEVVSSDRLIEELWGDRPPPSATKLLQGYVSQLRRVLGAETIATRGPGYVLRAPDTDAAEFERLVGEARGKGPGEATRMLGAAVALWRGAAFADVEYESWAQAEIAKLEELRLVALEDLLAAKLQLGAAAELVPELEALVVEHPLRERLRALLMLALYRSGRQADALEAFVAARGRLVDELGIEPGRELQDLQRRILAQDAELGPVSRPPLALRKSPLALVLIGATLILGAAAAAILELTGGSGAVASVRPGAVGTLLASTGRLVGQVAVAGGPARLTVGGRSVWVGSDASGTIAAIDPGTLTVSKLIAIGGFPSDLAVGSGWVWVVDGRSGLLKKIDPSYGTVVARVRIADPNPAYDESRAGLDPVSVAAGAGSIWVTSGSYWLTRVDPATAKVTQRIDLRVPLDGVAVGASGVWAISGSAATAIGVNRRGQVRVRIPIVSRPGLESPYPIGIAVGDGSVWVLNGNTGSVTKIDPAQRGVSATIPIGIERDPLRLAVGPGAVWVADGDGSLARIDADTDAVKFIPVGHRLEDVVVAAGSVWASATSGLITSGGAGTTTGSGVGPRALPASSCSPIYYEGGGRPRFLIASDLPLQGAGTTQLQMAQAIEFVLQERHFRAGRYAVGYQSCDDSTAQLGEWSPARCAENARAYERDPSVIGIVGTWNSPCSAIEIPILNRARGGPVAIVSPANTYVGLTRSGPGTAPGEPGRYYPTGRRNFVRVIATDEVQGAADALLAHQLGVRRAYVLDDGESYGAGLAADFTATARMVGLKLAGTSGWDQSAHDYRSLARRVKVAGADGVFLAGLLNPTSTGLLIRTLRGQLGPGVRIMAPDAFADFKLLVTAAGSAAEGMTVSLIGLPNQQLPKAGQTFVHAFGRNVAETPFPYSVYAAQAATVLLDAIASSNGTRASVTARAFKTKITNGLIGNFSFDRNGDATGGTVTMYRIVHGNATVLKVITPPQTLVHPEAP